MVKRLGEPETGLSLPRSRGFRALSPFAGRDEELCRLDGALISAAEGQGGIIFLTGQPGIGKTRLARQALALAKRRDFTVLEGRAYPLQGGLAYAPIHNAFYSLLRSLDPTRLANLVSDLPDLGRLFSGLSLPPSSYPLDGPGDPGLEKTRLFATVARVLERLAQQGPVALFIDDLHCADPASLELLDYLAHTLTDQPVLFLITYAADALDASHGLKVLMGSLERDGRGEEVVVPRLGADAVEKLVRGILGGDLPDGLLSFLDARGGGVPLFVEALLAALVDSGSLTHGSFREDGWVFDPQVPTDLPPSVRRVIQESLARLEPAERHVLESIAVVGEATSYAILRAMCGEDERNLFDIMRRLQNMGLVAPGTDGSDVAYSITHPLIQEVVCAEVPEIERRRAHAAVIDALESLPESHPIDAGLLARHYRAAGIEARSDRALEVLLAAGKRAESLYANEEAERDYLAALAIVRERLQAKGSASSLIKETLPGLLERLGGVWERIGKWEAAVEAWNEALAELEGSGDGIAGARLNVRLALAEWNRGHYDAAHAHLRSGMNELAYREPSQELVDLYSAQVNILNWLGDPDSIAKVAADLLSLAKQLGSPQAEVEAYIDTAICCIIRGEIAEAREHAIRALVLAEHAKWPALCSRGRAILVTIGMYVGDHEFMRCHAEHGLALAHRLGRPRSEVALRAYLAFARFMAGDWNEWARLSVEAIALARRTGYPRDLAYALAWRAMVLSMQRDLPGAAACISEARAVFPAGVSVDRYISNLVDIAEVAVSNERGLVETASSIVRRLTSAPASGVSPSGLVPWFAPLGLMVAAEAQVAASEWDGALDTARKIAGLGSPGSLYLLALASRAEGLARLALGQNEAAMACLMRAEENFSALGMPFEGARCLLEFSAAAEVGQPEAAAAAARRSLATFERLDARSYANSARRRLRGLGESLPGTRRSRISEGGLSERELEVGRLVAGGLSTSEIAERLSLSPHTVSTHLKHIYTRLSLGSRRDLVKYLMEAGQLRL